MRGPCWKRWLPMAWQSRPQTPGRTPPCTGKTPTAARAASIDAFQRGELRALVNVDVLSEGCAARPSSRNLPTRSTPASSTTTLPPCARCTPRSKAGLANAPAGRRSPNSPALRGIPRRCAVRVDSQRHHGHETARKQCGPFFMPARCRFRALRASGSARHQHLPLDSSPLLPLAPVLENVRLPQASPDWAPWGVAVAT